MATGFTPSPSSSFSDKEKTNHTRLSRLLMDIGRRVLQDVFDSIHPPSSLHGVLNSATVRNQLQRLRSGKILFVQQWNTLYPTSGIAESKNFDITLLFLLLRNICGLSPPASTGSWDNEPLPADQSMEADLVRIKRCRNELYAHNLEMALTDDEFEKHWDDIKEALNRLGVSRYKDQIEQLKFASMDHEKDTCFYALLQAWEESDIVMRNEVKAATKVKEEIMKAIDKIDKKLDAAHQNERKPKKNTEKNRKVPGMGTFKKIKNRFAAILKKNPGEDNSISQVLDVDLYAAKLKESITKQTDMQRKGIMTAESVKTDYIFTYLVVHYGKENIPQQRNKEDQRESKTLTEIKKCSEIFVDEDDEKNPKRIIVSGEPGIGKTMFSQKLVRNLATNNICIPKVNFTYLINFRQLNDFGDDRLINLRELLNLCPLLDDTAMIDEAVMEYMCENSAQLFVVFDGFDEYKDRSKILGDFQAQFPNCAKTKMPVAALVSKLIHKKILSDSVILVTSGPAEANQFNQKIHCDRYVEIKGFTENQVVEYVKNYFSSKPEGLKNKALDKVLGSSLYMEFGSIPFRCYLMCIYIEHEITSKRDNVLPATVTEFYSQVISCIERNYNRAILSLDEKSALLAVDKTLANFAQLATLFYKQKKFSFTLNDLKKLGLSKNESLQITSSNLILCNPVSSNLAFQKPTCEYSFAHFTIQEFFVGWYLAKMADAMLEQETTEMVKIFTSGLLGLEETGRNTKFMKKLLKCVHKGEDENRERVVSLRCLYEFGKDKQFTTQQLTTNPHKRYWDSDGWIGLDYITDSDCSTIVGLVINKSTAASSLPRVLHIGVSPLTCRGVNSLVLFLTKTTCAITRLMLLNCKLDDECVKGLSQHLPNTKITYLHLSSNEITDDGVKHIVNHYPSKLIHLNLSGNKITDDGVKHIVNHCPSKLTYLNLSSNRITDECKNNTRKWCKHNYPGLEFRIGD